MKYEIWTFTKKYAKAAAENAKKGIDSLEIELKVCVHYFLSNFYFFTK